MVIDDKNVQGVTKVKILLMLIITDAELMGNQQIDNKTTMLLTMALISFV